MDKEIINAIAQSVAAILKRDITPVYDKPLYTTKEAAAFLGVRTCYIYELIRGNKLPYYRSGGGKLIYIHREDLIKWAQAMYIPTIQSIRQ